MNKGKEYPIEDKIEFMIAVVDEFGKAKALKDEDAWNVLRQNGCVKLVEDTYSFLHTQSFPYVVESLTSFIHRKGGKI
jgi:hypothetical protein